MCGRYTLTLTKDGIRAEIPTIGSFGMPWKPRYNIAPTEIVPAITSEDPASVRGLRWGLIPSWAKDATIGQKLINARGETLEEKPSFRNLIKRKRCLVLADGFFEWQNLGGKKRPIYIRMRSGRLLTFAGLWDEWNPPNSGDETIASFTIVTTAANELIQRFHHRMPVIIDPEFRDLWIDCAKTPSEELTPLIKPSPARDLEALEVGPSVNKPGYDSPECIKATGQIPLSV